MGAPPFLRIAPQFIRESIVFMADKTGNIVLYAKGGTFEYDPEDGTVHTLLSVQGMEVRVIQNRANFLRTGARADKMRRDLASQEAEIIKLSDRKRSDPE